jgi:flagellar biosynthesis protein FliR
VNGFLLVLARLLPLFTWTPVAGGGRVPLVVRLGGAGAVAALLGPALPAASLSPAALGCELALGFALAFGAAVLFWGLDAGGALLGISLGRLATGNDRHGTLRVLWGVLSAALFFVLRGHEFLLRGIVGSYRLLPVGRALAQPTLHAWASSAMHLCEASLLLTVAVAAPVLVAVLLGGFALSSVEHLTTQNMGSSLTDLICMALGVAALLMAVSGVAPLVTQAVRGGHAAMTQGWPSPSSNH